jgi:hypothetical protein
MGGNRDYFVGWFVAFLLCCAVGVVQGQEAWYLISEEELRSIEAFRERSEAERLSWLSQASELTVLAGRLRSELRRLNDQLLAAREAQRKSELLYEQSEAEKLTMLSLKSGEIADLKEGLAAERVQTIQYKGQAAGRLFVIVALAGAWALWVAFKVYRFFRPAFPV